MQHRMTVTIMLISNFNMHACMCLQLKCTVAFRPLACKVEAADVLQCNACKWNL